MLFRIIGCFLFILFTSQNGGTKHINPLQEDEVKETIEKKNHTQLIDQLNDLVKKGKWDEVVSASQITLQQVTSLQDSDRVQVYILLIRALNEKEQYEDALRESDLLFSKHSRELEKHKILLKEAYYQRAYTCSGLHNQKHEIEYTQKALDVMQAHVHLFTAFDFIQTFNDLYYYQINYEDVKGMNNTFKQYLKFYKENKQDLDQSLSGFGRRVFRKMEIMEALNVNDPEKAKKILYAFHKEVAKPISEEDKAYLNSCYSNINSHYYFAGDYTTAISFGKQYLSFAQQTGSQFDVMLAYSKLGTSYEQLKDYSNAIHFIDLSLSAFPFSPSSASLHALKIIKAKCLAGKKEYKNAALLAEQTITTILAQKLKKRTKILNYHPEQIKDLNSHNYINIFASAGLLFLENYKSDATKSDLEKAEKLLNTSAAMFREFYLKGEYNSTLHNLHSKYTEGLLYILTEKYGNDPKNQKDILNRIEENSSKHLYRSYQKKSHKMSTSKVEELADRTLISDIQNKLSSDQQILKYYVLPEDVYRLSITKDSIALEKLGKKEKIEKLVVSYVSDLKDRNLNYKKTGTILSLQILPDNLKQNTVVISDNFLNYLPFETLTSPQSGELLIEKHHLSYSYSLAIFLQNLQPVISGSPRKAIVFSPSYLEKSGFEGILTPDIPHAQIEAGKIAGILDARILEGTVRKQDFTNLDGTYRIYHFAMHAYLDDENFNKSCLLFSDSKPLFFEELYQMNLPAEMVVLGACNTGSGKLKNGEGIMSLSFAFSFAGTRSNVYSLWEVPDLETAEIMSYFYTNLKKGHPKDEAMARAKNEFISNNPMKSHPFFWAGFVVNGDVAPLFQRNDVKWLLTGLILFGSAVLLFQSSFFRSSFTFTAKSKSS